MNTKTCTKCHIEKPLDEFHRRGHRHQNICKTCRLESAKQPHTPRVKRDNRNNFTAIGERINELEANLRAIAKRYSNDQHEADDIYSHICERLLTEVDPSDSNSRILTVAKWRAGAYAQQVNTYTFFVGSESEIGGDDEQELDAFETYIPDQPRSLEDMVVESEMLESLQKTIRGLDTKHQQILSMLADGESQADIARKLNVSRSAITIRLDGIRQKLMETLQHEDNGMTFELA